MLESGEPADWSSGLDPATNASGSATSTEQQAIFGGLFMMQANDDGSNARIVPNQAESATFSADLKTLTIHLRSGIKFSDGTPLDAQAVIWNFKRDSESPCCAPRWNIRKDNPFTSPDPLTVVVHLAQPNASLVNGFPSTSVNWIASPTAYEKLGKSKFALSPVGAGPFAVVSNKLSSQLVLKRNPHYFKAGLPYLDSLTFKTIGSDQAAYQALLAGSADAYENMSTTAVVKEAKSNSKLVVTEQPGTAPIFVELNTMAPPFNNIKAREAMYYATDWDAIRKGLFNGDEPLVQSFTTPAGLFYHATTPGYRSYDLAKAKQLVQEIGGLNFKVRFATDYAFNQLATALQTQWKKAGMHVTLASSEFSLVLKAFKSGDWQTELGTAGAWDPAIGLGLGLRFSSSSQFTGVKDPNLDKLIDQGVATKDPAARDRIYRQTAKYISDHALGMFGFPFSVSNVTAPGVHGPGLTTKIPPLSAFSSTNWAEVWRD